MNAIQLCWLRNDLRLYDNHALWHASQNGPVVAVCLLTPDTWLEHDDAPVKVDFWRRNLEQISEQLARLNIPLKILRADKWADAAQLLLNLAADLDAQALFFNDEYGVHEQQRDDAVAAAFTAQGLQCERFTDLILFKPGSLLTQAGSMFKVYSQFRKQAYQRLHESLPACLPAPDKQQETGIKADAIPKQIAGYQPASAQQCSLWPAGEDASRERLALFTEQIMADYDSARDLPDVDGTSRLSAYLVAGVLSPANACTPQSALIRASSTRATPVLLRGSTSCYGASSTSIFWSAIRASPCTAPFARRWKAFPGEMIPRRWKPGSRGAPAYRSLMQRCANC